MLRIHALEERDDGGNVGLGQDTNRRHISESSDPPVHRVRADPPAGGFGNATGRS
jgi:hypothetical protein